MQCLAFNNYSLSAFTGSKNALQGLSIKFNQQYIFSGSVTACCKKTFFLQEFLKPSPPPQKKRKRKEKKEKNKTLTLCNEGHLEINISGRPLG